MNACAALAASVRVLGRYQGLKIHPGGTPDGGVCVCVKNTRQRKTESDKRLKR